MKELFESMRGDWNANVYIEFPVGCTVWDLRTSKPGVVIYSDETNGVIAEFGKSLNFYTADGKLSDKDETPLLYKNPVKVSTL